MRLATVSHYDRTLAVWEVRSGKCLHRHAIENSAIACAAFTDDPNLVLYLAGEVHALDLSAGKVVWKGERNWGDALAVSPDGKTIAVQGDKAQIDLLRVKGFARVSSLPLPPGQHSLTHLCWSPSGKMLACSTSSDVFLLWDVERRKQIGPTGGHQSAVKAIATARGGRLVTAGKDDTFRCWNYETAAPIWSVPLCLPCDERIALSPDGTLTAGFKYGNRRVIQVIDISSGKVKYELKGHNGLGESIVFGECGETLVSASSDGTVRVWDLKTKREKWVRKYPHPAASLGLSPGGKICALYHPERGLFLLRVSDGKELGLIADTEQNVQHHVGVRFIPDNNTMFFSSGDAVRFVDVQTTKERFRVRFPKRFATVSLDLTADRRVLAVAGVGELALIETNSGQLIANWPDREVNVVCFAGGDRELLAGSQTSVLAWDLPTYHLGNAIGQPHLDGKSRRSKELLTCWDDLGDANAKKAFRGVWRLVGARERAVALLRSRLRPAAKPDLSRIERLVSNLASKDFQTRQRAEENLTKMGELAEPALRRAADSGDPEVRRRAKRLLGRLVLPVADGEQLRAIRSAQVLELIGTEDARRLLAWLAGGAPEATLTREAVASLARLEKRAKK